MTSVYRAARGGSPCIATLQLKRRLGKLLCDSNMHCICSCSDHVYRLNAEHDHIQAPWMNVKLSFECAFQASSQDALERPHCGTAMGLHCMGSLDTGLSFSLHATSPNSISSIAHKVASVETSIYLCDSVPFQGRQ